MGSYSDFISSAELVDLVLGLHTRFMVLDDVGLRRRITEYPRFCLEYIELDKLQVNWAGWSRDARIHQYSTMPLYSMPPIVLGCIYPKELGCYTYEVIDGVHRAVANKIRGEQTVLVYVPVV